jgi:uncharacterized phage protein (TIGR02218 family)
MREISTTFEQNMDNIPTNLILCWRLKRKDGVIFCFTEATQDIRVRDEIYLFSSGLRSSAIEENCNISVDNFDVEGILQSDVISEKDILNGLYDKAVIEVFLVNVDYSLNIDENQKDVIFLKRGYIGAIRLLGENKFVAEVNGFLQLADQHITQRYSLNCRANFCDKKCGLNVNDFVFDGEITKILDKKTFQDVKNDKKDGYFDYGIIILEDDKGQKFEQNIKFYINKTFELTIPAKVELRVGMRYKATAGCDKSIQMCIERFKNVVNFRGEPYIPGMGRVYKKV